MLRPNGNDSHENNLRRQAGLAIREAITQAQGAQPHVRVAQSQGISAVVQSDGEYDEEGNWVQYLRCGDALDSAGCAP